MTLKRDKVFGATLKKEKPAFRRIIRQWRLKMDQENPQTSSSHSQSFYRISVDGPWRHLNILMLTCVLYLLSVKYTGWLTCYVTLDSMLTASFKWLHPYTGCHCQQNMFSTTHHLHQSSHVHKQLSKVKVKVSLEQATKAQRGSRGIALLFL